MDAASPPARPAQSAVKPTPPAGVNMGPRKPVQPGGARQALIAMPDSEPQK